jgi:hypothetical protein
VFRIQPEQGVNARSLRSHSPLPFLVGKLDAD